ncbi:glycosyltransferase family 4 protein [Mycobacterium scrofulaceum]|uniref:Glycosyl transferase family 1 n=1 Tax=Mycobacterium scrofulaceum TaxID=1783 RepID=A0A1X0KAJ8_MYCSC|nr:glycosyltransferase family 1 protein [Mycobacterium scrofulaceum]ORB72139.1 glycosyl transferase family 1 [Mycobacterium scrofulaceum]
MKVAFDHHIFSMQRYGGVSRYFVELATRLPAQGVETSVIAPLHINTYLAAGFARSVARGRFVNSELSVIPLAVGLTNRLVAPLSWRGASPDIIHETFFSTKPFGKGQRRVVTVYDMIHELFMPEAKFAIAAKRAAVARADHIICISENTRQDLLRLHDVDAARTSVVHLGYSLTAGAEAPHIDSDGRRPTLLYVGHRGGYKNFKTVLHAYGSSPILREFDLIAFGGYPPQRDEQSEISRLGITDRVRFESGSDQELAARYRAAAAFVYPSKYEGFGIPPLEAMSYGCPVVCSTAGPIPEVVGDAGVYFDPNSADELRTALEHVVTAEELQADLRARGYARIKTFSWDRCAAETAAIYREMM